MAGVDGLVDQAIQLAQVSGMSFSEALTGLRAATDLSEASVERARAVSAEGQRDAALARLARVEDVRRKWALIGRPGDKYRDFAASVKSPHGARVFAEDLSASMADPTGMDPEAAADAMQEELDEERSRRGYSRYSDCALIPIVPASAFRGEPAPIGTPVVARPEGRVVHGLEPQSAMNTQDAATAREERYALAIYDTAIDVADPDERDQVLQAVMAVADQEQGTLRAQRDAALARLADVWDEAAEATADWMANNPSPSGIPHDPPRNPYEDEWTADPEGGT